MAIITVSFQVSQHGPTQRRIQFLGRDEHGATHKTGTILTTDPTYNPADHVVAMGKKIERLLGKRDVASWIQNPSGIPSLAYATKSDYRAALHEHEEALADTRAEISMDQARVDTNRSKVGDR